MTAGTPAREDETMDIIELVRQYLQGAEDAMAEGERIRLRAEGARHALERLLADIEKQITDEKKDGE